MKSPLQIIEELGAPTHSYIKAVQFFTDYDGPVYSKEEFEQNIADIIGSEEVPSFSNQKESRLFFMYAVQETVRAFLGPDIPDMDQVWDTAVTRARNFIAENPW